MQYFSEIESRITTLVSRLEVWIGFEAAKMGDTLTRMTGITKNGERGQLGHFIIFPGQPSESANFCSSIKER
jgi:hypothetical protein